MIIILLIIILTSWAGYLLRSLTTSGAIAASIVGFAVFIGFGTKGLIILGAFFATSSLWSKYKGKYKNTLEDKLAKGSRRDWRQVAANGGVASLFGIIYYFFHDITWLVGFTVCIASANSDTWASEIGSLSKKEPLFIRTFKRIEKGTSGAISLLGTLAAIAGALLISFISFWFFQLSFHYLLIIFLFGFLGNVIDTLIGAFYQQVYYCSQCKLETEKKIHCHMPTTRIKGLFLVDNDMVNLLSGFLAAILAAGLTLLMK